MKRILIILISVIVILLIGSNSYGLVVIKGNSMSPTLNNKSIHIYKKISDDIEINRNDIVIVKKDDELIIKRIFGVENDTITCDGNIIINGMQTNADCNFAEEYSLKKDEYFLLGDNIMQSTDSRVFGTVKKEEIEGVLL